VKEISKRKQLFGGGFKYILYNEMRVETPPKLVQDTF